MDMLNYDPPLPELPLLGGLRQESGDSAPPRIDWAAYVIRLAQVVAKRPEGEGPG